MVNSLQNKSSENLNLTNFIVEVLNNLPLEKQQEILLFAQFVSDKHHAEVGNNLSFYDVAKDFIGAVDSGLGDLSTNKQYLHQSLPQ
ncbi:MULTISPECIES: hypothetical protein [unclassified Anabaena]|jgi:hypothetical protein|uniref:hypothetical protein n=1 Tax=unclassified Anabaena TaxID=2619674 RepID=UPI001445608C|nr:MULTISPECIES: hypothetical protein [unclassified Anabaena]MTJ09658.1 hypothetical protein [Anabaena sp. UHCC 0204]MTJ55691.1 hypothetical protein [Anabaena sp. UHCC 0253]